MKIIIYVDGTNKGMYVCPCCENPLYSSRDTFDSNQDPARIFRYNRQKSYRFQTYRNYNTLTKELTCKIMDYTES